MLPDHALHTGSAVADHHARAGSKRMEVARCKWRGALLGSTRTGCRAGQRPALQFLHGDARQQSGEQQCHYCSDFYRRLYERGDLEAQSGNDRNQYESGQCGRAGRTCACQRPSTGAVHGRQASTELSGARHGIRAIGSGARCTYLGVGSNRCAGQASHYQLARGVFCATSIGAEPTSIVASPNSSDGCVQVLPQRQLQSEHSTVSARQGPSSSW